ncbi:hypothetical protein PVK06_000963 [Gossypium arboreum]|uniref:Reverse transcriptase domain-containing protein n=1 Tax=Gossypium arboreum TaxID=29729 RepID=A0ABR0R124_GOSAR|nr:hypothetical protein PVK06_000963 [Gossypium arboreum]
MKLILPNLIFQSQSAFVPRRLITDNVMVVFELIHHMKNKSRGSMREVALKIDISKSYDKVDCELRPVIPHKGFRQEDSPSLYLFILCTEGPSYLLRKAELSRALHGVSIC